MRKFRPNLSSTLSGRGLVLGHVTIVVTFHLTEENKRFGGVTGSVTLFFDRLDERLGQKNDDLLADLVKLTWWIRFKNLYHITKNNKNRYENTKIASKFPFFASKSSMFFEKTFDLRLVFSGFGGVLCVALVALLLLHGGNDSIWNLKLFLMKNVKIMPELADLNENFVFFALKSF